MAVGILMLLVMGLGLFWLLLNTPAQKSAAVLTNAWPILLIGVGGLLTLFRLGAIGLPLAVLGFSLWRRRRPTRPAASAAGRTSTVRSACLEMELDHDSGELDGTVLTGSRQGARLSALAEDELAALYREVRFDRESVTLLESFLDRYHPHWRERMDAGGGDEREGGPAFDGMTRQEAYQILGLAPGASREEIHRAWRRLIKVVHPDAGGSAFLTAKINAARDILLD